MNTQIWGHAVSGERFAVQVDESGTVVSAAGPLHHSDIKAALSGFDSDADLVDDINGETDNYVIVTPTMIVGTKLTMEADGLTGEMVVTAIETVDPELDFFNSGDIVRVHETIREDGVVVREYDTFFNTNDMNGYSLVFNKWIWRLS